MAGGSLKTYDLKQVYLTLGGYRIGGYGEAGGIDFEFGADILETTVGADGDAVVSRTNNQSMTCSITVMETSHSYRRLAEMMDAQAEEEEIGRLEFLMEDELNGDKVTAERAAFVKRPAPSKSKKVGERTFVLFLAKAGKKVKLGASITR